MVYLSNDEKRATPRVRLSLECRLTVKDCGRQIKGQCQDLSSTGAKVLVTHKLPPGTQALLQLTEHIGTEPYEAHVEVIRSTLISGRHIGERLYSAQGMEHYLTGLKIIKLVR